MKIDDKRKPGDFADVRQGGFEMGDVVETESGEVCLVVWADKAGRPSGDNPGYNGLVALRRGHSYTDAANFPKVRKVNARLVVEKEPAFEQAVENAVPTTKVPAMLATPCMMPGQMISTGGYPITKP